MEYLTSRYLTTVFYSDIECDIGSPLFTWKEAPSRSAQNDLGQQGSRYLQSPNRVMDLLHIL